MRPLGGLGTTTATVVIVVTGLGLLGCPPDDPLVSPDAGARPPALTSETARFRLPLIGSWTVTDPRPTEAPVVALAAARRAQVDGLSLAVAPRIEVTIEPTVAAEPESAFRMIKGDVELIGSKPDVRLLRSALGLRPVGAELVGDLDVRYRVGGAAGREVRQRALLVYRTTRSGTGRVLTITASYMARDEDKIGPEVQRMFAMLQLLPSPKGSSPP